MNCPPLGICLPVTYHGIRDGDTVTVQVPGSAFIWAVRLLDCWCEEVKTEAGLKAKIYSRDVLEKTDPQDLKLWIPLPTGRNILQSLSFDRILGVIYIGPTQTLNQMLINMRLATSTKTGKLGE